MARKILLIGVFTGVAHILSFYGVSFIVKMNADKLFVSKIAEIESAIVVILAIMSFGLQQVATRDIAIKYNWKAILLTTQKTRFSMGIFLSLVGVLLYLFTNDIYYVIFFMAPLIALNVDYALYGRGLSIEASFLSLIKVGVPAIILIILGYNKIFNLKYYIVSVFFAWIIIGYFSNKRLNFFWFVKPTFGFFKSYFGNIKIGFTDIALTTLKLGILSLAKPFYDETIIADAFVVLKLYILVKGVQRVVFQAFYKDLVSAQKAFLIDKIGLIIGFLFFSITLFYPNELILLVFSEDYLSSRHLFIMIGFATLISSISISASPRMLLISKDKAYINSYLYAFVGTLLFLFLASNSNAVFYGIIGAILFGETILNMSFFKVLKKEIFTKERFFFLIEIVVLFLLFTLVYFLLNTGLSILVNAVLFMVYGLYFMLKHKKQIL